MVKSSGEAAGLAALSAVVGLFGIFAGFLLAGSGEGWVSAFFGAMVLPFVYPWAVWLWLDPVPRPNLSVLLLGVAAIADVWLIDSTLSEGRFFVKMWDLTPPWLLGWVAIWLGWQVIALLTLRRRR